MQQTLRLILCFDCLNVFECCCELSCLLMQFADMTEYLYQMHSTRPCSSTLPMTLINPGTNRLRPPGLLTPLLAQD